MPKDLFSEQSRVYARYRPTYPAELFDYILQYVEGRDRAWDCATGNGQAARMLAEYFTLVQASDISSGQLENAIHKPNIEYLLCPAEATPFKDNSFDLITVATAYHWLDLGAFHKEATRVGKPGAVVAVWAYHLIRCEDEAINKIIDYFYYHVTAPYWHPERKYVDERYATIPFAFELLPEQDFLNEVQWTKEAFKGYLQSWSAVQNYGKQKGTSPLQLIREELDQAWPEAGSKTFHFPLFLRMGWINK